MIELHPKNPNMYLTRSYTSSMMAMVDMMDLIRPDHVQSHLGKFCDDVDTKLDGVGSEDHVAIYKL